MLEEKTIKALEWIINILNRNGIPYQISGGFAAFLYGSSRKINDIDIDIPEDFFDKIIPEIQDYIIYGPKHFNDGKWDLNLITINYHGQEIDLGGANNIKVSNKERTKWIPIPVNFEKNQKTVLDIEGREIQLNLIDPQELINYKSHLDGEHQKTDIDAVNKFLEQNKTNIK